MKTLNDEWLSESAVINDFYHPSDDPIPRDSRYNEIVKEFQVYDKNMTSRINEFVKKERDDLYKKYVLEMGLSTTRIDKSHRMENWDLIMPIKAETIIDIW